MQSWKYKLTRVVLISIFVLFGWLIISCNAPALARERVFLNLSLDFLGEYKLPKIKSLDTPVGGLSAITYDRRRDRFYAVANDPSKDAPARFYTLKIPINSNPTGEISIDQVDIESVTQINKNETTQGSIIPKGIAVTPEQTVFISGYSTTDDQIAPFVQEFNISGKMLKSLPIPERYFPNVDRSKQIAKGIQKTSAFETLTFNPAGTIPTNGEPINLFTATASALVQDQDPSSPQKGTSRLLHYLISYAPVLIAEYFYPLDSSTSSLVELISVDKGGHFLSLERSGEGSDLRQKIFQVTTGGATDTSRIDSLKGEIKGIKPIKKKLLLDLNDLGIELDNLLGMTLGPRLKDGTQSLLLFSENNSNPQQTTGLLLFRLNTTSQAIGKSLH